MMRRSKNEAVGSASGACHRADASARYCEQAGMRDTHCGRGLRRNHVRTARGDGADSPGRAQCCSDAVFQHSRAVEPPIAQ